MGNAVEKRNGEETRKTEENREDGRDGEACTSKWGYSIDNDGKQERAAVYRKYQHTVRRQIRQRQIAIAPELFRNSCPSFEQGSPVRKRLRNGTPGTNSVHEYTSVPDTPFSFCSSFPSNRSPYAKYRNLLTTSTPGPVSLSHGSSNTIRPNDSQEMLIDEQPDQIATATKAPTMDGPGGGPITKAVISRGLKARFKSISAWLLNEPAKATAVSPSVPPAVITSDQKRTITSANGARRIETKRKRVRFQCPGRKENGNCSRPTASFPNSSSFPSGVGDSLKRWSSLRASFSLGNVASKLRREASNRSSLYTPTRSRFPHTVGENTRQSSVASLNSLSDGRTPWPVPWLEAIFLPEFPAKGTINEKAFAILGTIAKGAFGRVYRVALKVNSEEIFAMKVQSKSDVITQNAVQQIKDEVSIHQTFANYPFIAQLYCTWQSRSKLYIVLQYVEGYGDLYQLWRDEGPFNEDAGRIWGAELAMAIDYMHANGVIYRDLKMENVMLDDDGHIQLVDFGLAKWMSYGDRTSTICGTLQYMAPEVLRGEQYNHAVDWWSLGALLHTLMTGAYPYSGGDTHTSVKIDDYVAPSSLSVEAQILLSKLLRKDPNWRLRSFTMYKTQPFFKGVSFDSIRNKTIHPFDYIPRMRRCNTCNIINEDSEGLEESDLAMYHEEYDALKTFDSLCDEDKF